MQRCWQILLAKNRYQYVLCRKMFFLFYMWQSSLARSRFDVLCRNECVDEINEKSYLRNITWKRTAYELSGVEANRVSSWIRYYGSRMCISTYHLCKRRFHIMSNLDMFINIQIFNFIICNIIFFLFYSGYGKLLWMKFPPISFLSIRNLGIRWALKIKSSTENCISLYHTFVNIPALLLKNTLLLLIRAGILTKVW
jgi:hypothetical protein